MYLENLLTFPYVSANTFSAILFFIFIQRSHPLTINKMCKFILLESCPGLQLTSMEKRICTKENITDPIHAEVQKATCFFLIHTVEVTKPKDFSEFFFLILSANGRFLFFQLFGTICRVNLPLQRSYPLMSLKNHLSYHSVLTSN